MTRIHGEIEFEFKEDGSGEGEFLACGKVVNLLKNHVARGQLDEAAGLLASCAENVGDELISDITSGGASKQTMGDLAEMFFKARDFNRAAKCAYSAGRFDLAAKFLEADYDLERAAGLYLKAGKIAKAAELFEKNLTFNKAAELFLKMKDFPRAAENLERAGDYFNAGQLYLKMARWDKAVDVLQRLDKMAAHFVPGVKLLGQVLERTGNSQLAMQKYLEVVKSKPLDAESLEIHYRLAKLCADNGFQQQAGQLLNGILGLAPQHQGAREVAKTLGLLQADQARARQNAIEPVPLDLSEKELGTEGADRLVGMDKDFEFLRRVPLFSELSLDELKYVQSLCEKKRYQDGQTLITEGTPGEALFVLARGKVKVVTSTGDSAASDHGTVVAELGPGAHVGEMALLDDFPTSASVICEGNVVAFKLARRRFSDLVESNERIQVRIYKVLIKTLTKRLREANEKLAAKGLG
ncbi:MAG: cyclic nucleotide-binding domain-containing protein [Deltaproteobacteria bacterium]|nr:cyclic nucleotide-binding domain-containing protein [Deltaproteobacteria bacterium]